MSKNKQWNLLYKLRYACWPSGQRRRDVLRGRPAEEHLVDALAKEIVQKERK